MRSLAFLAVLLSQSVPRQDPETHLAEAARLRELALFDRAEEVLRAYLKAAPTDSQSQKFIPDFRIALCEVLLGARNYEELKAEAEILRRNPKTRIQGLAFLAAAAWHAGAVADAAEYCDEADRLPIDAGAPAESYRSLKRVRSLLGWKRHETATHVVYYPPDSPLAAKIVPFGRRLDVTFDRVRSELDAPFQGKIEAYFFNDQTQADALVERSLTTSLPALRTYYARADAPPGFAIAQVLGFFVGNRKERRPPRLAGLCEGFFAAHADDPRWDRRREELPRKRLRQDELEPLSTLLAEPGRDAESFAMTGSFVRWLIRTRGRERFRRLWADYNELAGDDAAGLKRPWVEIYGATLEDLEAAWRSSIK
jgi:hypothetical protein